MTVQTSYSIDHGEAYEGMPVDLELCNTVSRLNKSGVVIPYGHGVVTEDDNSARLPTAGDTAEAFNGSVMRELNRAYTDGQTFGALDGRDMTVITHGAVWGRALAAVTKDDPVYLVVSDGTGTNQGKFTNVVGAGATLAVEIIGAKWVSSAGAGDLAKISLGLGG